MNDELLELKKSWMIAICSFVLLILLGGVVYRLIEGWGWEEGFFMTFFSVTTVGYRDISQLDDVAKWLTMVLMLGGISIMAYITACFVRTIAYISARNILERKMDIKRIDNLNKHFVVCGYGRIGKMVAEQLKEKYGNIVVIVDNDNERIEAANGGEYMAYCGDAKNIDILKIVGIERASYIFLALSDDKDNIIVTALAKKLNSKVIVVAKVSDDKDDIIATTLRHMGADYVIDPYEAGAASMMKLVKSFL